MPTNDRLEWPLRILERNKKFREYESAIFKKGLMIGFKLGKATAKGEMIITGRPVMSPEELTKLMEE